MQPHNLRTPCPPPSEYVLVGPSRWAWEQRINEVRVVEMDFMGVDANYWTLEGLLARRERMLGEVTSHHIADASKRSFGNTGPGAIHRNRFRTNK